MTVVGRCTGCQSAVEAGDLRCAVCSSVLPVQQDGSRTQTTVQVMRCEACGAALSYDANAGEPKCAFCDSTMHVESIDDPMEQTELFLPFTVTEQEARASVRHWLSTLGFFRPSDLASDARVESVRALYWVCWVFRADSEISWAADSNAGSRRSAWAPHSGQSRLLFDEVVVSASRGLTDAETEHIASSYDLSAATRESTGPAELVIEQFDVQRSEARSKILDAISTLATERIRQDIPGSRFRNIHIEPFLRALSTRRFAFPAYVMAYHYRGRPYRAVLSAHDGSRIVGSAPLSWFKIVAVAAAILGVIAIIIAVASGGS